MIYSIRHGKALYRILIILFFFLLLYSASIWNRGVPDKGCLSIIDFNIINSYKSIIGQTDYCNQRFIFFQLSELGCWTGSIVIFSLTILTYISRRKKNKTAA